MPLFFVSQRFIVLYVQGVFSYMFLFEGGVER